MKEEFRPQNFRPDSLELINSCDEIINDFMQQGLRLTLRQLYYQLVTKNIIKNEERSYKNLSNLVSDARLAGHLDWDAIEDRIRVPSIPAEWENIKSIVESALYSYRLPTWKDQPQYVELWVEKDALAGVLRPLAEKHHVTMMVNRGYSSQSAMYEASKRFMRRQEDGKELTLLYLGDFDPSGEDMVRDIADRMQMFGIALNVRKIALTMDQVRQYNPPPNPAKIKDPRAAGFIAEHGASSWEVDAINPTELRGIITRELDACIDKFRMTKIINQEGHDKARLREAVEKIMGGGSDGMR